jgi:hypothetical protein
MWSLHSLIEDRAALGRLSKLYVAASFGLVVTLYASVLADGYEASLAALTLATGVIALLLLHWLHAVDGDAAQPRPRIRFQEGQLLNEIDRLLNKRPTAVRPAGLLLVSAEPLGSNATGVTKPLVDLVQSKADSHFGARAYQIDPKTVAVAASGESLLDHLERLGMGIQGAFRIRRAEGGEFDALRLTVGVAITERGDIDPQDLVKKARSSIVLAESRGRDFYSRRV